MRKACPYHDIIMYIMEHYVTQDCSKTRLACRYHDTDWSSHRGRLHIFYSERPRGAGFRSVNPAEGVARESREGFSPIGILATPRVRDSPI